MLVQLASLYTLRLFLSLTFKWYEEDNLRNISHYHKREHEKLAQSCYKTPNSF